jgi:PAS domain S-box-containing protein
VHRPLSYRAEEVPKTLDFCRSALCEDDAKALWDAVDRHLKEGTPYDVECCLQTKGGAYRWFRTRGESYRDATGEARGMAGSLQDIHERKVAEMALTDSPLLLPTMRFTVGDQGSFDQPAELAPGFP